MIIFLILLSTIFTVGKNDVASPKCPSNMVQSHKDPTICYFFVANTTSFDDAEKFCIQNNGNLAPVLDAYANIFISDNAFDAFKNSQDFWIGGKSVNVNDATIWLWNWHNSFPFYFDWDRGEPSKNGCMASTIKTALWTSQDCGANKPFVCQIPAIVEICESEWTYFNRTGMCYRYMTQTTVTLTDAQNLCQNQNSNLVSIHSNEENSFLTRIASYGAPGYSEQVLLGLQYTNSAWKWLDGTDMNYENWGPNRPWYLPERFLAVLYPEMYFGSPDNWTQKWDNYLPSYIVNRFICKRQPSFVSVTEKLM